MKIYQLVIVVLIELFMLQAIKANIPVDQNQPVEKIFLHTDRTLYVSGENIEFSAFILNSDHSGAGVQIMFCELITPDGNKIKGGKFRISSSLSSGNLLIPQELVSGIYYLRAYTKGMRIMGPRSYSYTQLKIINPYKKEVQKIGISPTIDTIGYEFQSPVEKKGMTVSCNKETIHPYEEFEIVLNYPKDMTESIKLLSLSVIPDSTLQLSQPVCKLIDEPGNNYVPLSANPGITLSGHLVNKQNNQAVAAARINLSISGEKDFIGVNTDSTGNFYFSLPAYSGTRELFISTPLPGKNLSLTVDNDYSANRISLPAPAFSINDHEKKILLEMARNQQISHYFNNDSLAKPDSSAFRNTAFYGKPTEVLWIDNYIQLPTLEEYFNETPSVAKVRYESKKPYFQFICDYPEMKIFEPLLLVDYIAMDNIEKILSIHPSEISRIDLVNAPYVKGNMIYGGIINIISRKGNYAAIELPTPGFFFNFDFICKNNTQAVNNALPNIPDTRNTLYWNPDLKLDKSGMKTILLKAPETEGKYIVYLRGVTISGSETVVMTSFIIN
jgi:hypothetical protein